VEGLPLNIMGWLNTVFFVNNIDNSQFCNLDIIRSVIGTHKIYRYHKFILISIQAGLNGSGNLDLNFKLG